MPQRGAGSLSPSALLAGVLRALGYRGPLSPTWLRLASAALALLLALAIGTGALAAARAIINLVAPPQPTAVPTQAAQVFALDGPIEQLGTDSWVVSGIVVRLGPQTTISGMPTLGATAHVRGAFQDDGTLLAHSITVDALASAPTIASPATSAPLPTTAPPPVEATAVPPVEPTLAPAPPAPEPTAQPTPEPPAPSGDLFEQLRVLLVAATADGRAGQDGPDLIGRLDLARQSLSNGDRKKAEEQMREIRLKLREKGREGKMDAEFVRQAQALVGAIADAYDLPIPAAEEGGDKPKEDDKADKDDKDDDKGKDD